MELKWLEDFVSLSETKNFSRTADNRNITQSALSRRIQSLEHWLGVKLVDRSNYPISLTLSGESFYPYAVEIIRAAYLSKSVVNSQNRLQDTPITFAMQYGVSRALFPAWLQAIEIQMESFNARVKVADIDYCLRGLKDGSVDFMFCYENPGMHTFAIPQNKPFITVGSIKMVPVSVADEEGKAKYQLPGLVDNPIPYLGYSVEAPVGWGFDLTLANKGLKPFLRTVYEASISDSLQSKALEGRGLAWLPYPLVKNDLDKGRLVLAGDETWFIVSEVHLYSHELRDKRVNEIWKIANTLSKFEL